MIVERVSVEESFDFQLDFQKFPVGSSISVLCMN